MINFTPIARTIFKRRLEEIARYVSYAEAVQREQLTYLLESASYTEYGQKYRFANIQGYNQFKKLALDAEKRGFVLVRNSGSNWQMKKNQG